MLERLLDLAVYAMMAALVAIGVGKILDQRREAQTVAWTEAVTRAMDRLAGTQRGYQDATGSDASDALVATGLLPAAMVDRNSGATPVLRNGFGGAIAVTAAPGSFTITQDMLPAAACVALVARARDWAQQVCVNGTCTQLPGDADTLWAAGACVATGATRNTVAVTAGA